MTKEDVIFFLRAFVAHDCVYWTVQEVEEVVEEQQIGQALHRR